MKNNKEFIETFESCVDMSNYPESITVNLDLYPGEGTKSILSKGEYSENVIQKYFRLKRKTPNL